MNWAAEQALKDISEDYKGVRQTYYTDANGTRCIDTWFVSGLYLYNVENRDLNKKIGAAYLNSGGRRTIKITTSLNPIRGWANPKNRNGGN